MKVRSGILLTLILCSSLHAYKARRFSIVPTYSGAITMSLCFHEAFEAKNEGRISEREYIGHLTAHLRGVRHDFDQINEQRWNDNFHWRDPFGALFRKFALSSRTLSTEGNQNIFPCSQDQANIRRNHTL